VLTSGSGSSEKFNQPKKLISETCTKDESKSLGPFSLPGARNAFVACYVDTV